MQEEQTKMKTSKTRKRKLVQKMVDENPPTKKSSPSVSTSPSHLTTLDGSTTYSNGINDAIDHVDGVGYGQSNCVNSTGSKLGKRPHKHSRMENKRTKRPAPSNSYHSPSNSFPNSPLSVSSSLLNLDTNSQPSPLAPPTISVTPPKKYSKFNSSKKA